MKEGSEGDGTSNDTTTSRDADSTMANGNNGQNLSSSQSRRLLPDSPRTQVMGATLAALGVEVASATSPLTTGEHTGLQVSATLASALLGIGINVNKSTNSMDQGLGSSTSNEPGSRTNSKVKGEGPTRDKVFVCSVCNRCFGYKHVLQNHERTHTGEKPFECKECHKRFTRDHHLKTHMRLHTGEKPYHCTHCERQFVQVANLRRHLRVHTGERPYACNLCTSRFSDSNQLKAHVLIHEGVKPFECQKCHGRFRRRHHLVHHKCPKDEANMGKPRRGRRPKAYDQLPTTLPIISPVQQSDRLPPQPEVATMAAIITTTTNNNNNSATSPSPQPPQLPPAAHTGNAVAVEKSRRKPLRTIRILTPQQQELFLREQETMQTQAIDMSVSSATASPVSVIVPRALAPPRYIPSPMEGVLDLSNSRSDSEAEPIEEEVDEGDFEEDYEEGLDSDSEDDRLRGPRIHSATMIETWEDEDGLHRDDSNDGHGNGERLSDAENSDGALQLTTS